MFNTIDSLSWIHLTKILSAELNFDIFYNSICLRKAKLIKFLQLNHIQINWRHKHTDWLDFTPLSLWCTCWSRSSIQSQGVWFHFFSSFQPPEPKWAWSTPCPACGARKKGQATHRLKLSWGRPCRGLVGSLERTLTLVSLSTSVPQKLWQEQVIS